MQRNHHVEGHLQEGPRGRKSAGGATQGWPRHPCSLGPQRESGEGQVPRLFSFLQNPTRYDSKFFPMLAQAPILIFKFGQPFSNLLGEIAPWYVTPPLIQFIFELMLCIKRKLLLLVPLFMLQKSMVLSFPSCFDAQSCLVEPPWVLRTCYNLIHLIIY